jgi:hypothetical protein
VSHPNQDADAHEATRTDRLEIVGREEELTWERVVVAEDLELLAVARGAAVDGHDPVDGLVLASTAPLHPARLDRTAVARCSRRCFLRRCSRTSAPSHPTRGHRPTTAAARAAPRDHILPLCRESCATGAISVVAGAADGTEELEMELEMVVVCRKGDGEGRSRADWEEDSAG